MGTGRARFSWLFLNLVTAILASVVIALFQDTIERIVMLAVLMPIAACVVASGGWVAKAFTHAGILPEDIPAKEAFFIASDFLLQRLQLGFEFVQLPTWLCTERNAA